jgi:hypothetical protein
MDKPRYSADQSLLASKAAQMRKAAAEDTGDTTMDTGMDMAADMPSPTKTRTRPTRFTSSTPVVQLPWSMSAPDSDLSSLRRASWPT